MRVKSIGNNIPDLARDRPPRKWQFAEAKSMTATILRFPPGGRRYDIRIERESGDLGWLVLTHDRRHGWLHGDFNTGHGDACGLAKGRGVAVTSSAGRWVP